MFDRRYRQLWDTFEQQQRSQEWGAGFIAPLLSLRAFSMGMAGTDFGYYRNFASAAEDQRRTNYRMYAPDDTDSAFQTGRVDRLGRVVFQPDRPGPWRIELRTPEATRKRPA